MSEQETSNAQTIAPAGCLLRLLWSIAGSAAMFLSLAMIAASRAPLLSYLDAIVWGVAAVMIAARRLDITLYGGRTISDDPADLGHWRRYTALLLGVTLAAWSLAHLIGGSFTAG